MNKIAYIIIIFGMMWFLGLWWALPKVVALVTIGILAVPFYAKPKLYMEQEHIFTAILLAIGIAGLFIISIGNGNEQLKSATGLHFLLIILLLVGIINQLFFLINHEEAGWKKLLSYFILPFTGWKEEE